MRRARAAAIALAVLFASAAAAQQAAIPDVPSGSAALRGRLVHAERPEAVAGVDVVLYSLTPGGHPGVRRTTSDAEGRYAFEGIASDPDTSYLVGAHHAGIPFPGGRVSFGEGVSELEVEIPLADLTDDPAQVRVAGVRARLDRLGNQWLVHETVELENPGPRAYLAAAEAQAPEHAAFESRLPRAASGFSMPLGIVPDGVVLSEGRLAFYGPIYPGPQELSYSYVVPVENQALDLGREFGRAVEQVEWLLPEAGIATLRSNLEEQETLRLESRSYARHQRTRVAAGQPIVLVLDVPELEIGGDTLSLEALRIFLELDDAALLVREEYRFEVGGELPAVGIPEAPLMNVPLPLGAYNLRFHPDFGLQPSASGGIDLLGPVPAGESVLEILYRLPRESEVVELERSVSLHDPLLSVYVADSGLLVESDRLHRKRPVRTPDRLYMHFEAFEVGAGEPVALRLETLAPRAGLPRSLAWGFALAIGLFGVAFLTGPLRTPSEEEATAPEASPSRRERDSVVEAIHDLDHDYETGKVSETDYESFREELRARALALLREERLAQRREHAPVPTPAACPTCAAAHRPGDRFCAQCGAPVERGAPEGREALR
jgi:hypothetical protein